MVDPHPWWRNLWSQPANHGGGRYIFVTREPPGRTGSMMYKDQLVGKVASCTRISCQDRKNAEQGSSGRTCSFPYKELLAGQPKCSQKQKDMNRRLGKYLVTISRLGPYLLRICRLGQSCKNLQAGPAPDKNLSGWANTLQASTV
jgi:hypothetical protein